MTTITLNNPELEQKYSSYELKMLIIDFLQNSLKEDSINMYEVSVQDLPEDVLESYKNINNIKFIKR